MSCARASSTPSRLQVIGFIWLLCFPSGLAMQWLPVLNSSGQVTYHHPYVPPARSASDLMPLTAGEGSGSLAQFSLSLPGSREVCVFVPEVAQQGVRQPLRFRCDVRAHGNLLQQWFCDELDLHSQIWRSRRILTTLPDLPQEQYIIEHVMLSWDVTVVPVDLRPLQGPISLQQFCRTVTAAQVLERVRGTFLRGSQLPLRCYLGQIALHESAQPFLHAQGDSLLIRGPLGLGHCTASAAHREVASTPGPFTFDDCNAVILSDNGFIYLRAPAAYEESPDWAAFQHQVADMLGSPGVELTRARDSDIATPHVAFAVAAGTAPASSTSEDALVTDVPSSAPTAKHPGNNVLSYLLLFFHGRRIPFVGLLPFAGCILHVWGHPFLETNSTEGQQQHHILVAPDPPHLSIAGHQQLAKLLHMHSVEHVRSLPHAVGLQAYQNPSVGIRVWHPSGYQSLTVPLDRVQRDLSHKLRTTDPTHLRGRPVLLIPQFEWPFLQFLSPSKDKSIVTIVADVGKAVHCYDLPKTSAANSLLDKLGQAYPASSFRVDRGLVASIRHGDVIRVHDDEPLSAIEIGHVSALDVFANANRWLHHGKPAYVLGPDFHLLHLPSVQAGDLDSISKALVHILGPTRCKGVTPQPLQQTLFAVDIFCFPRPGQPCHVFVVTDSLGHWRRPLLQAWESHEITQASISELAAHQHPHAAIWTALLDAMPAFLCQPGSPAGARVLSAPWTLVIIDAVRAAHFGRHFTSNTEPETYFRIPVPAEAQPSVTGVSIGVQTSPSYWPGHAAPLSSASMPALPAVVGCTPLLSLCPDGSPYTLQCPQFGVDCVMPCLPGYHAWGVRIGIRVFSACTIDMDWQHVLDISEGTPWDLSGMAIFSTARAWHWPEDLRSFSGQCGHLLHTGSDPYLCQDARPNREMRLPGNDSFVDSPIPSHASVSQPFAIALFWLAAVAGRPPLVVLGALWLAPRTAKGVRFSSSSDSASSVLTVYQNSTRTCTMAWCHELSCQTTHFEVNPDILSEAISHQVPHHHARLQMWRPYHGPVAFEVRRPTSPAQLEDTLRAAGHEEGHALYIAFDTGGTTLDLLSVPRSHVTWWIVRDGLSRELLRPVTRWVEPGHSFVLTLNSHGQAHALTYSPEAADMAQLPQGVRAVVTRAFPRVTGQMTSHGLTLMEIAIGTISLASALSRSSVFCLVLAILPSIPSVAGMQQQQTQQDLAVRGVAQTDPWGSRRSEPPTIMRIWSHTGVCPLEVPYCPVPDPRWMATCVAESGRGFPPTGDFVWTQPQIIQDVAHILHLPPRTVPPFAFWLLHYRAQGHVIASLSHVFDWAQVSAQAAEAFGNAGFGQGHFGIYLQGRIYPCGGQFPVPPHGAVLHLVRTPASQSVGQTLWDSPQDTTPLQPFDYDICLGADGSPALISRRSPPRPPRAAAQGTSGTEAAPRAHTEQEPRPEHSLILARQLEAVAHSLSMLTTRLESAGVLPASATGDDDSSVAPWTRVEEEPTPASNHCRILEANLARLLACTWGCTLIATKSPLYWACTTLCMGFPGAAGDGAHSDSGHARSGPSQPVTPDLPDDFRAPTPEGGIVTPAEESPIVRPSDDPFAHTSLPGQSSLQSDAAGYQPQLLPVYQRRVTCALQGLLDSETTHPFLPAGCPFVIHNPFTGRSPCRLVSSQQSSERAFRMLHDHAARRGWQPIVAAQPQPDAHAIHLIPSAADPSLASVLLQGQGVLQPACLARTLPRGQGRSVQHNSRTGRIVAPYADRRHPSRTLHLRDGDCLQVNHGPFGPPVPVPMSIAAGIRLHPVLVLGGIAVKPRLCWWAVLLYLGWTTPSSAMQSEGYPERQGKPIYRLSSFPWRVPTEQRDARPVCDRHQCRYSLLCPWTGAHGVHTAEAATSIDDIWLRYSSGTPGWPNQRYYPVWPAIRHHVLTVIPWPPSPATVCVVVRIGMEARALLLPTTLALHHLCRSIQFHTSWEVGEVRLPPSLLAAHTRAAHEHITLRTGDVIEVLHGRADRAVASISDQELIREHAAWTQGVRILRTLLIRLWNPTWPRPIITWLPPDTEWLPDALTFSGNFAEAYPGRWVPIPWSPSLVLQFMQVSGNRHSVHVLLEDTEETKAISVITPISRTELAEELHTSPLAMHILGLDAPEPHQAMHLRDGDILHDNFLRPIPEPHYGWPDDDRNSYEYRLPTSLAVLTLGRRHWLPFLGCFALLLEGSHAVRSADGPRSRSPSTAWLADDTNSPRIGRYRPDELTPLRSVITRSKMHHQVLCPYLGWGPPAYALHDTQLPTLTHVMHQWSSTWAPYPILIGGTSDPGPALLLLGGLPSLAVVVILTPGAIHCRLLPRITSIRRLYKILRRQVATEAALTRPPPALRPYQQAQDLPLRLRDGDCFELCHETTFPAFRTNLPVPEFAFRRIPHLSIWHAPFRVCTGGWAYVWSPSSAEAEEPLAWQAHWISSGELWSPTSRQFHKPGVLPGLSRWIPSAWIAEGELHFVEQSEPGQACILQTTEHDVVGCVRIPNVPGEYSTPHGWVLRPDIRVRAPMPQLRDGDVVVPESRSTRRRTLRPTRAQIPVALAAGLSTGLRSAAFTLSLTWLFIHGQAMPLAPLDPGPEPTLQSTVRVGRYPWRVPSQQRSCNSTVDPGHKVVFLSPFTGCSEPTEVQPDTTIVTLQTTFSQSEPPWHLGVLPVWPAIHSGALTFVPVALRWPCSCYHPLYRVASCLPFTPPK